MKIKTVLLIGIMLLFAACGSTRITSEIYLLDIDELADSDGMTTKVLIGLPISSQDECAEMTQRYKGVFRKSTGFKGMEFVRCYESGYDDFAEYELEVPIRMADPYTTSMQGTFEIIRHDDSTSNNRNLYIRSNPKALCNLNGLLEDEFYRSLDLSDVSTPILVSNDLRQPQTLILNQVFVNNLPVIEPTEFVMERRDTFRIVLSDVTSAWVFDKSCNIASRTALVATWVNPE